jgi:hypothetical protein
VRQRITRKRKDRCPGDNTHYGKAFEASCKLLEAEARLANDKLFSSFWKRLTNTVRDETIKLERLTERDREMTRLLAQYLSEHGGEMRSYRHFIDWGVEWCTKRGVLTLLTELTELDERTIQYRLQNQYGAQGRPGRKPSKKPSKD